MTCILMNVAVMFVVAGASAPRASRSALRFRQGGGRPMPTPKPAPTRRKKRPVPRARSTAASGKAKKNNAMLSAPGYTSPPRRAPAAANPNADILLPDNFMKLEGEAYVAAAPDQPSDNPLARGPRRERPLNTTGKFPEIANKRKIFVNVGGKYGDKMISRLRAYDGLEIVRTAREADFALSFYDWAFEERLPPDPRNPLGEFGLERVKIVKGGTLIVTIRDPSERVPRVIWRKDDTSGGVFKRGEAVDKLTRRFIDELKKLRGEN
jgi:hypothetical protein